MTPLLGIFAKEPVAGTVKTRLAAQTSPAFAAAVAEAFLADTLARMQPLPVRKMIVYAPADADFRARAAGYELEPQAEGDLGARLSHFFESRFAAGDGPIVVIGTDSPTLPVEFVTQAFEMLRSADVVLGPATDGGYYLIGLRRHQPELFRGIAWSVPTVLADTVKRVRGELALLPPWYDVDTLDDWRMLCGHLQAIQRAAIDLRLSETERLAQAREAEPPER
jgi:rSAM/selenodomain-associated transferase 1